MTAAAPLPAAEPSLCLSEGHCPYCLGRLGLVAAVPEWEHEDGEVNVGECLRCEWTFAVIGGDFNAWVMTGWTSKD